MTSAVASRNSRRFRFGSRGSLMARSRSTKRTSEAIGSTERFDLSSRIRRAYFLKRAHSAVVGIPLKTFPIKGLSGDQVSRRRQTHESFGRFIQTLPGKVSSNGYSCFCVPHNASNTGSTRHLQQHARATAVASPSEAASSPDDFINTEAGVHGPRYVFSPRTEGAQNFDVSRFVLVGIAYDPFGTTGQAAQNRRGKQINLDSPLRSPPGQVTQAPSSGGL